MEIGKVVPPPGGGVSQESEALERLLSSGVFDRAPGLAAMLRYVCAKYFDGKSDEIKEYSIAVEALGRPPDFDKRRDSIVRVEAHRLRKRLLNYYQGPGAQEPVRITLPEGSYVPLFIHTADEQPAAPPQPVLLEPAPVPPPAAPPRPVSSRIQWLLIASAVLPVAAVLGYMAWRGPQPGTAAAAVSASERAVATAETIPVIPAGREFRILAGRGQGAYNDRYGQSWEGDRFFSGGTALTTRHQEVHGLDRNYFTTMRAGDFRYDIPLEPGVYEVHLVFADTESTEGSEGDHSFNILANGQPLLSGFDVVYDAGRLNEATTKVFKDVRPASDGKLHLEFQSTSQGRAFVNAIAVLPGIPGRMRPIRMVARKEPYRESDGKTWQPDHFVNAGVVITRPTVPFGHSRAELFRGERYGNFTYTLPVAPDGRYTVTLYMNEFWFGPEAPGKGGPGSRIFRVFCNHKPLLDGVDVFRESGGNSRPLIKVFRNLQPNAKAKLVLDFEPVVNYALINAIEVVDEGSAAR